MQTRGLHHRVPHESVILFIYSFYLLINPVRRLFKLEKYLFLTKVNKHPLQQNTELYGTMDDICNKQNGIRSVGTWYRECMVGVVFYYERLEKIKRNR